MTLLKTIVMLFLTFKLAKTINRQGKGMRAALLDKLSIRRKEAFFVTPPFEMNILATNIEIPKRKNFDHYKKERRVYNQDTSSIETNDNENMVENDTNQLNKDYKINRNLNDMMEVLAKQNELVEKLLAQHNIEINKKKSQIQHKINEQINNKLSRRKGTRKKKDKSKIMIDGTNDNECVEGVTCISPYSSKSED